MDNYYLPMKKLRYLLAVLLLCFCMGARADNIVTISSTEGAPDEEVTVSIGLQNTDVLSSLQVSIPLDENLSLVSDSGELSSRCASHFLTVGVNDGILNVFIYSVSMADISGTSGEVASFKLKLGNQPSTISLNSSKLVLTNSSGDVIEGIAQGGEVTTRCAKAQYSTMEVNFGEVPIRSIYQQTVTVTNVGNADLTITDLVFSDVMTFSSTTTLPIVIGAGRSKTLNITYAPEERGSISKTLKVECNSISKLNTIKLLAKPFAVNELHIQPTSGVSDEEVTVSMKMNNMDDISGYQVEFDLPEQFEYVENSFTLSDRKQDHVATASIDNKKLRILAYSPTDKAFTDNDGEIGSFKVKLVGRYGTTLTPTKTVLSATISSKVENVVSAVYGGEITIQSPTISCNEALNFGAVPVTEACEKAFTISNYGSAPLTVSRIVFNNEAMSIKESLPIVIQPWENSQVTVVYSSVEQTSFGVTMHIYSNDPDLRMKEVSVSGSRFAPNYMALSIPDVSTTRNLSIDISLDNYDAITGVQFDVQYPAQYESFDGNISVSGRATGMTATVRQIDDHTLRCFCYSMAGGSIAAGTGKVMTLSLKPVGDSVPTGSYRVSVNNVKLGTSEMADKYAGANLQTSFNVYEILLGDANNDGDINMADAKSVVNYILGNPDSSFNAEAADANQDGKISMADVMFIVNYINNGKFPDGE